jgi:hypothetical protein
MQGSLIRAISLGTLRAFHHWPGDSEHDIDHAAFTLKYLPSHLLPVDERHGGDSRYRG